MAALATASATEASPKTTTTFATTMKWMAALRTQSEYEGDGKKNTQKGVKGAPYIKQTM